MVWCLALQYYLFQLKKQILTSTKMTERIVAVGNAKFKFTYAEHLQWDFLQQVALFNDEFRERAQSDQSWTEALKKWRRYYKCKPRFVYLKGIRNVN